jgi:hypothetical protein
MEEFTFKLFVRHIPSTHIEYSLSDRRLLSSGCCPAANDVARAAKAGPPAVHTRRQYGTVPCLGVTGMSVKAATDDFINLSETRDLQIIARIRIIPVCRPFEDIARYIECAVW